MTKLRNSIVTGRKGISLSGQNKIHLKPLIMADGIKDSRQQGTVVLIKIMTYSLSSEAGGFESKIQEQQNARNDFITDVLIKRTGFYGVIQSGPGFFSLCIL